jgi:hypothetical protein
MSALPKVDASYGAPMGRPGSSSGALAEGAAVELFPVLINAGGYDEGGAYWGLGDTLYQASMIVPGVVGSEQSAFFRAKTLAAAKQEVLRRFPGAVLDASADMEAFVGAQALEALKSSVEGSEGLTLYEGQVDFSFEAKEDLRAAAVAFWEGNPDLVQEALAAGWTPDRMGQVFWNSRTGSGVSFSDDGDGPAGAARRLDDAARAFLTEGLYVGADGLAYSTESWTKTSVPRA